jgi:hypothetical protein
MSFRSQTAGLAAAAGVCVVSVAACGGGGSSPTGPAPATVVTVSFPGGSLFIGSTTQFDARETLSDGTTRPAPSASWSSDRPQVASVSNQGVVNGVTAGEAIISADVNGARGSLTIRVFPNFGGSWTGTETAVSCVDSGALTGFCSVGGLVGEDFLHSSSFIQNQDSVTALLETNEGQRATMSGSITVDGELRLNSAQALPPDPEFSLQVENWRSRTDTPSRMTGTYDIVVTISGLTGSARVGIRLNDVVKSTASSVTHARRSGSALRSRIQSRRRPM